MAGRAEHDGLGFFVGALAALGHAMSDGKRMTVVDALATGFGGAVSGLLGSRLPDTIEPATSSWHRSTAHSAAATAAVTYVGARPAARLASRIHAQASSSMSAADRLAMRFAAGATVGLPAGYVSHTLADARTPRSIPLLTKRF